MLLSCELAKHHAPGTAAVLLVVLQRAATSEAIVPVVSRCAGASLTSSCVPHVALLGAQMGASALEQSSSRHRLDRLVTTCSWVQFLEYPGRLEVRGWQAKNVIIEL